MGKGKGMGILVGREKRVWGRSMSASQRRKGQAAEREVLKLLGEEWRPYPPCPVYEVSSLGRVRSVTRELLGRWGSTRTVPGRLKALAASSNGYLFFGLSDKSSQKPCYVHKAVLLTFVGDPKPGQEACHNNGDKADNRLENLRWDTRSKNALDKIGHGTMTHGERHGMARLTEDVVRMIRSDPRSSVELGMELGVNHSTVQRVRRRQTWAHVE